MTRLRSTGGFWLLLGVLLLALSARTLLWFALACLIHELGHSLAIRMLGGRVDRVELTGVGAVLHPRRQRMLTYREECIVALGGPLASLFLAVLAAAWGQRTGSGDAYLLAGLSLALAVFNLAPAAPLDGGRVLRAVLSFRLGPDRGDWICRGLTASFGVGLAAVGLWVLAHGGNFTLLLCAIWLLARRSA